MSADARPHLVQWSEGTAPKDSFLHPSSLLVLCLLERGPFARFQIEKKGGTLCPRLESPKSWRARSLWTLP